MAQYTNLHMIPITLFILMPVTFFITYFVAVLWDHVHPTLPYISETGAISPESCIFAQLLNIAAVLLSFCVYIRHRQICRVTELKPENGVSLTANNMATLFGALSCIGLDVLANFQESRSAGIHMMSAITCFATGNIYFCMQTVFSCLLYPHFNGLLIIYIRGSLCFLSACLTVGTILPGSISMQQFNGTNYKKWLPSDGGWNMHIVSTLSEWFLTMVFCAFILTFVYEFRKTYFFSPRIEIELNASQSHEIKKHYDVEDSHKPPNYNIEI